MTRARLALVLLGMAGSASAEEASAPCKVPPATTKISATFSGEASLEDLSSWVTTFTCKNVVVDGAAKAHAPKVSVLSPKPMTPKQALQLYIDAVVATGLAVQVKKDTIVVTLGPKMPRTCPQVATTSAPPPSSSPMAPLVDADAKMLAASVTKIDDTNYEITQAAVQKLANAPGELLGRNARITPAIRDSQPEGFHLYAIRADSFFARLGFVNGDTIHKLAGAELTGFDVVLDALARIRNQKLTRFEVELTRRGKRMTVTIMVKAATTSAKPVPPAAPPPSAAQLDEATEKAISAGIKNIDDNTVEITRAAWLKLVSVPADALAGQVRFVPTVENGKHVGFRVFAVRAGSLPARLGFSNGDTLHKLGGTDLLTAADARAAFKRSMAPSLTRTDVELTRRGQRMTLTFTVKK